MKLISFNPDSYREVHNRIERKRDENWKRKQFLQQATSEPKPPNTATEPNGSDDELPAITDDDLDHCNDASLEVFRSYEEWPYNVYPKATDAVPMSLSGSLSEPNDGEDELPGTTDGDLDHYNLAFLEGFSRCHGEWPYSEATDAAPLSLSGSLLEPGMQVNIDSSMPSICSFPPDDNAFVSIIPGQTGLPTPTDGGSVSDELLLITEVDSPEHSLNTSAPSLYSVLSEEESTPAPTECQVESPQRQVLSCPSPCHLPTDGGRSLDELSLVTEFESLEQSLDTPASSSALTEYQVETYSTTQALAYSSPCHLPTDGESSSGELSLISKVESPEQSLDTPVSSLDESLDVKAWSSEESLDTASSSDESSDTDASSVHYSRPRMIPNPRKGLQNRARLVDTRRRPSLSRPARPLPEVSGPGKTPGKRRRLADDTQSYKKQKLLKLPTVHQNPKPTSQLQYQPTYHTREKLLPRKPLRGTLLPRPGKVAAPSGDADKTGDNVDYVDTSDEGVISYPHRALLEWGAGELANLRAWVEKGDSPSSVAKRLSRPVKLVVARWQRLKREEGLAKI